MIVGILAGAEFGEYDDAQAMQAIQDLFTPVEWSDAVATVIARQAGGG